MAVEGEVKTEFKSHEKSYDGFIKMMKWGTILSLLTGAVVVLIIAN